MIQKPESLIRMSNIYAPILYLIFKIQRHQDAQFQIKKLLMDQDKLMDKFVRIILA